VSSHFIVVITFSLFFDDVSVEASAKMAFQHVGDPEALTQCPYDNTHMIRNKRMQYHLVDCRKVAVFLCLVAERSTVHIALPNIR